MRHAVSDLEALLFTGLAERPIWSRFLIGLARDCGVGHAFLVIEGAKPTRNMTAIVAPDPDLAARLSDELSWAALADLPAHHPIQVATGLGAAGVVRIALASGRSIWLVAQAQAHVPAACLDLLTALVPALQRALPIYEILADSERARRVAEYVIETSGTGALLVDADGHLVSANSVAEGLMAEGGPLSITAGRVRAATTGATQEVLAAVADMAGRQSAQSDPDVYVALALPDPDRLHPLTLIIRPGPPYGPVSAPLRRTAVIILRDPARPAMLAIADLERLFGLTRAEARLATRLADGDALEDAALALGVSRNTARSQLQAIYLKTGVNRQGDLVRLLLSSAASHVGAAMRAGVR